MPRYKPILERFNEKYVVNPTTECWEWQGTSVGIGYGVLGGERGSKSIIAHRFSYAHHKGPIPEGMIVCHKCDNPACVNPDHLFVADHLTNMKDMAKKGRARRLSAAEVIECQEMFAVGTSMSAISREFGVSRDCVTRALEAARRGDFGGLEGSKGSKYYTILSEDDRKAVLVALKDPALSIMRIAKMFNVDRRTVRNIRDGKLIGRYSKITKAEAEEIIAYWKAGFRQAEIGEVFGVDQTHVSRIVRGKSWAGVRSAPVRSPTRATRKQDTIP